MSKVRRFIDANKESPVVYGAVIGDGGRGAMFRLADDRVFTFNPVEVGLIKPRWAFEEQSQ